MSEGKDFDLGEVYDYLIDWPSRLFREEGFFRRLFGRTGARTVLDTACGGGQHAAMFHSWGMRVEGADVDPALIEQARENFGEPPGLSWAVRGFEEPVQCVEPFDAAVCIGNALSLAGDEDAAGRAVAGMLGAVGEGGTIFIHLLNVWSFEVGPVLWQKCRRIEHSSGEAVIIKGAHRSESEAWIEMAVIPLADPGRFQSTSIPFLCLEAEDLRRMAERGGAADLEFYGGYGEEPYVREKSVDLLMVARKKAAG
jgi:SAM-dependent methyltransferase